MVINGESEDESGREGLPVRLEGSPRISLPLASGVAPRQLLSIEPKTTANSLKKLMHSIVPVGIEFSNRFRRTR